ncbi:NAD-dependent deacetylase [Proteobacteria bacterium 005FR1]|nr:NAD-dependent deacetylase [Proteobacteria bacterium 005FR1]
MQQDKIATLAELIAASRYSVAFTGAGISTESGIPDFRSPGGVWDKYQPIYFDDFVRSEEMRRESWRRKLQTDKVMNKARPNKGHAVLAELVREEKMLGIITQNIDNLHQVSGVPDEQVVELHGNSTYAKCLDCEERYELAPILEAFEREETLPTCTSCGGLVKTATVSFGQAMPAVAMARAEQFTADCDLFIVLGSSLQVYPAAGFPEFAVQSGAKLVIINRDPTGLDHAADLVIHDSIGETLASAVERLPEM